MKINIKVSHCPHATTDPVGQFLAVLGLSIGVTVGSLNGYKDLSLADFTSFRVGDGQSMSPA
jgi:hypothetical protein